MPFSFLSVASSVSKQKMSTKRSAFQFAAAYCHELRCGLDMLQAILGANTFTENFQPVVMVILKS